MARAAGVDHSQGWKKPDVEQLEGGLFGVLFFRGDEFFSLVGEGGSGRVVDVVEVLCFYPSCRCFMLFL